MDEITEKCLKIIELHENGILQSELWKLAKIDSRKCSRIIANLINYYELIERVEVRNDGIKTFLLKRKPSNEKLIETIESTYCNNENVSIPKLIEYHRLIVNSEIVRELPIPKIKTYKILDRPLLEILLTELMESGQTISQLSKKHGIVQADIRRELFSIMKKQTLIEDGLLIRRSNWVTIIEPQNPENVYSIIPIPLEAKIFDPLLGFSLLNWVQFIHDFEESLEKIPQEDVFDSYRELCCEYWEMTTEKFNEIFQKFSSQFINSIFGPIPVITSASQYESINEIISDTDTAVLQLPFNEHIIEKKIQEIEIFIQSGFGTIPEVEYCVIALMDVMRVNESAKINQKWYIKKINKLNERLFQKIFAISNLDLDQLFDREKIVGPETEIPLKIQGEDNHRITFTSPSDTLIISGEYLDAYQEHPQFSVYLHSISTVKCIANCLKEASFFKQIPATVGKVYTLDIKAEGNWVIEVNYPIPDSAQTLPFHIIGENDSSSDFFVLTEGKKAVTIQSFNAESIIVTMKNSNGKIFTHLIYEVGPVDKKITIENDILRICNFDVKTSGKWIIDIKNVRK
jgi:hypothetical protein